MQASLEVELSSRAHTVGLEALQCRLGKLRSPE